MSTEPDVVGATGVIPVAPTGGRAASWRRRRDRVVALRAISIPTAIIRRFFKIDGIRMAMLMAFNLFISLLPLAIIAFAILSRLRHRISLSEVFIEQFRLHGSTAQVVRTAFPQNRNVAKIASAIVVASFAISGFDVASAFQRTFADAWQAKRLRGWRGPVRGGLWFVLVLMVFAVGQVLQGFCVRHGFGAYFVAVPIVMFVNYWFWIATPRLLLDKRLERRDLRPGALLGMVGSTALWGISLIILPSWFSWYGLGFGGVGIALALLSWTYVICIVWVVIVVIAAVVFERHAPLDEVVAVADGAQPFAPPTGLPLQPLE